LRSARAMATSLLLAARELGRVGVAPVPQPDALEQFAPALRGLAPRFAVHDDRPVHDVPEGVMCGKRLKRWKTNADLAPLLAHRALLELAQAVAVDAVADHLAVDPDHAPGHPLEVV